MFYFIYYLFLLSMEMQIEIPFVLRLSHMVSHGFSFFFMYLVIIRNDGVTHCKPVRAWRRAVEDEGETQERRVVSRHLGA